MNRNNLSKLEALAVKAEQLSSLSRAITDALVESGNNPMTYADGMSLFDDLLKKHARDMNTLFEEINAAHGGGGAL